MDAGAKHVIVCISVSSKADDTQSRFWRRNSAPSFGADFWTVCHTDLVPDFSGTRFWPIRKENEVALQRAEMRMVRWMCGIKLQDRVSSEG